MGYTPHVLVIGGGATGTGVARDLAMRGLEVTLVERGKLTDGATGRMQGLLHSGARYADTDPSVAADCLAESRTLKSIADHCVQGTSGLFVSLAEDDGAYFERKREACADLGMDAAALSGEEVRDLEPSLTPDVERGFEVPDASVDPFRLTVATAKSAQDYGATIETHTPVTDLLVENGAVAGVEVNPRDGSGTTGIDADYVVNAAGARADELASMAGLDAPVALSKRGMVVMDDQPTDRVITRSRLRDGGDAIVPYAGRCILGTADEEADGAEAVEESEGGVDRVIEELAALAPELRHQRAVRAYWGVRPRYRPPGSATSETEGATRNFALLDHEERDDTWGMTTVVGGTVTTHRLLAEEVADHVCAKFGIDRECLTATEPLPGSEQEADIDDAMRHFGLAPPVVEASRDRLGSRTSEVLETNDPNPVLCDCETVTRAEVRAAMDDDTAARTDLTDVRIRTRAGMGECQGGRCCHALASDLYPIEDIETIDRALDDLYEERWTGQRHVLWGDQLAQAMRNYDRHARALNRGRDHRDLDLAAFDSGPEWDEDDVNPRGGGFQP